jgi:hypothetical protein
MSNKKIWEKDPKGRKYGPDEGSVLTFAWRDLGKQLSVRITSVTAGI